MPEIIKEIDRLCKQCLKLLEEAPSKVSQTIKTLLQKTQRFIQSRPDLAGRAIPIFYNVYECLIEQRYADAIGGLALFIILLSVESEDNQ